MDNIYEFIHDRISKVSKNDSNCIGTAFYLVGELNQDNYISRKDSKKILTRMKISKKPELGCLVSWEYDNTPIHAGVIYMDNPFYVVYRDKKNHCLIRSSLEDFSFLWTKETNLKPIYRIPTKFHNNSK